MFRVGAHRSPAPPTPPPPILTPTPRPPCVPMLVPAGTEPLLLGLDRHAPGFSSLAPDGKMVSEQGKPVRNWEASPARDLFCATHGTDLHFVCYGVLDGSGNLERSVPRLTKSVLPLLVEYGIVASEQQVVGTAIALDYDLPQHTHWTEGHWQDFQRTMAGIATQDPLFGAPTLWYATSGGCRLVWLLAHAIPVEGEGGLEDILGGMVARAHQLGLPVDPACRDWTRLFRLPKVQRDDKPPTERNTSGQAYFRMSWNGIDIASKDPQPPTQIGVVDPTNLPRLSSMTEADFSAPHTHALLKQWRHRIGKAPTTTSYRLAQIAVGPMPEGVPDQAEERIEYKRLRSVITARANPRSATMKPWPSAIEAFNVLYGKKLIYTNPEKLEGLHQGILTLTRNICFTVGKLLGEGPEDITPEVIYHQVLYAAGRDNRLRGADQRPMEQLAAETWRAVTHIYRIYRNTWIETSEAQEIERQDREAKAAAQCTSAAQSAAIIREAMMRWVPEDSEEYPQWRAMVEHEWMHMLLWDTDGSGRSVVMIKPDGTVGLSRPTKTDSIFYINIRNAGHGLIQYSKVSKDGETTLIPVATLLSQYGVAARLQYSRIAEAVTIRANKAPSGTLDLAAIIPAPGIRYGIKPVYHPLVDEWLHALGGACVDKLLDWLASFPDLSRPIAGLYLQGQPSIGKGMLMTALTHMTAAGVFAPFHEALEPFQDTMMQTPLIWADEDTESSRGNTRSVMNTYKKLVTGEFKSLTGKGDKPITMDGNWRVVLTANTDRLLRWDEDTNDADLMAMVQRTVHILCDSEKALGFLNEIGGSQGTQGWPETHIPQHIQWLAQNRKVKPGRRLLVEGVKNQFHESLAVSTGNTDVVVRGLGRIMREPLKYPGVVLVETDDRGHARCYVNGSVLHQTLAKVYLGDSSTKVPTLRRTITSLKNVCVSEASKPKRVKSPNGRGSEVVRLHEINVPALLRTLDSLEESVDLRGILGADLWRRCMPETSESLALILAEDPKPPPPPPAPPSPPLRPQVLPGPGSHLSPAGGMR